MNIRTLIPASGFGTRIGMSPNQSKELLLDPKDNRPLIEWCLDVAINPLIIVRKEKQDLIDYCSKNNIEYIIVDNTKEWPDTVLRSECFWDDRNILMLPDVRYNNKEDVIKQITDSYKSLTFGVHEVDDVSKWGHVCLGHTQEKPNVNTSGYAWGVISFDREIGQELFTSYLNKTVYKYDINDVKYVKLENFKDITRNKTLELY